jgi:5-methylcytosine-specific restriction protein A
LTRRRFSETAQDALLKQYGGICQMCRFPIERRGLEWDHKIPLAMGGDDTLDNLHPLCRPCHRLKTKGDVGAIAKAKRRERKHAGIRKRSSFPGWKSFDGTPKRNPHYGKPQP